MWAERYWANRYFAPRYWCNDGAAAVVGLEGFWKRNMWMLLDYEEY